MFEQPSPAWRSAAGHRTDDQPAGPEGQPALRVLLAEDTCIVADMMQVMARQMGLAMDFARNGLDAFQMVEEAIAAGRPYSLVLMDAMMPVLDGVEASRRIRAAGIGADELPIVAVTAATSLEEVRQYKAAGMQAFLEKPVSMADLRATVQAWGQGSAFGKCVRSRAVVAQLSEKFAQRKQTTLATLEEALAGDAPDEALVMEVRMLLHKIAGSAGSFGQPQLGEDARRLEAELMKTFLTGGKVHEVIARAREALQAAI